MPKERRRFPRVRADFGVQYKIKDSDSPPIKAISVNIGKKGIMIKIPKKLDIGTLLELKITLPSPHVTISTLGRVVYVLDNYWDEYPPYRCGVEFLELKEKDREAIRKFVNEAIAKLDWKRWV